MGETRRSAAVGEDTGPIILHIYNPINRLVTRSEIEHILSGHGLKMPVGDIELYQRACTHQSYAVRGELKPGTEIEPRPEGCLELRPQDNELPEHIGDAIISAITTDYLRMRYPQVTSEGTLTKWKTRIVCNSMLGKLAIAIGLQPLLLISRKVEKIGGRDNLDNLGSMLEAWIDAIYTDANRQMGPLPGALSGPGFQMAQLFFIGVLERHLDFAAVITDDSNAKDAALHFYQAAYHECPRYRLISSDGGPGTRTYTVGILLPQCRGSGVLATATARKKQEAEQEASRIAVRMLKAGA